MESLGSFSGGSGSYDLSSSSSASESGDMSNMGARFGSRNINFGSAGASYISTVVVIGIIAVIGLYIFNKK